MFDDGLVQRIREAGKLPEDPECIARTGFELGEHLNLLKGIWIQHPQPDQRAATRSRLDVPRPTTPAQKFIHVARSLKDQLLNPTLLDARLNHRIIYPVIVALQSNSEALHSEYARAHSDQLTKLVEQLPNELQQIIDRPILITKRVGPFIRTKPPSCDIVAQRLLDNQVDLARKSLALVQRLAEPPSLAIQFHSNRVHNAVGAASKDEVRHALIKLTTAIDRLTKSPCCTNEVRRVLKLLHTQIHSVASNNGRLIGRWNSPKQQRRILRDIITVELRVIYRLLTESKDRHSKYDSYARPSPSLGHENEPCDLERPRPFSSIVRLTLEHAESTDEQIPGDTLGTIISYACDIVDPLMRCSKNFDWLLSHSLSELANLNAPRKILVRRARRQSMYQVRRSSKVRYCAKKSSVTTPR